MKKKITVLIVLFSLMINSGFGCKLVSNDVKKKMEPFTLEYWRVFDGEDAFGDIIKQYNEKFPYIQIKYKKLRYDEYEKELLNALAEDRGPDIFSIKNTWVRKYEPKIAPMTDKADMVYTVIKGTVKKEKFYEVRPEKSITLRELKNNFVDIVYDDVVVVRKNKDGIDESRVLGLPYFMDAMAMYYNKDLFNNARIAEPPKYWNKEFQEDVKKLTKQDTKGKIIQSGVALGGSYNIERYTDVLSALMMQNGAVMSNGDYVGFHAKSKENSQYNPGLEALRFYIDFTNPAKEVYCWNKEMDNSLDAFISGRLAMMFGYSYHLPTIKAQAPKLNFGVVPMPQIEGNSRPVTAADYWVETVSKKSQHISEAWNFIQFIANNQDNIKVYLSKTKKPTAIRSLVDSQLDDMDISAFAQQVLNAKSWYRGKDYEGTEKIIADMIESAIEGGEDNKPEDVISKAASRVQQTYGD